MVPHLESQLSGTGIQVSYASRTFNIHLGLFNSYAPFTSYVYNVSLADPSAFRGLLLCTTMKFILWSLTEKIGDKLLRKTSIRRTRKQSPSAPFPPQPPPPPSPHTVRASVTSFAASTATLSLADSPVMVSITSNTTPRPAVDDREIRSRRQVHADHGVENSALCQHPLLRYIPTEHTSDAADQDPYIHNYRVYLTTCITTIQEALRERELLRQSYIRAVADESDGTEVPHYQTPDHVEKEVYMLRDHAVAKGWGVPLQKSAPNSTLGVFVIPYS